MVTATFLTEDSYLGNQTKPLTLNRYNYCVSSYLNYTDPSGNWIYEDEINELHVKYNLLEGNYKMKNAPPTYTQVRIFLSAMREVDTIMFGNGNYFGDDDITPLYGISIEGITK